MTHAAPALLILLAAAAAGAAQAAEPAPPCTDNSRACLETVAQSYIDALISHDGSKLALAPGVRRTEQGLNNAKGPYEVRESFVRTHMLTAARDVRFYTDVEKGEVVVFYRLDVQLDEKDAEGTTRAGDTDYKVAVSVPAGSYTIHEAERFKVDKGLITEIKIISHVEKGAGAGSGWPVERDAAVAK